MDTDEMTEPPAGFVPKESPGMAPPSGFVPKESLTAGERNVEARRAQEGEESTFDIVRDYVVSAGTGASFNTLDEISAFGRSAYDLATGAIPKDQFGKRYDQVLEAVHQRQESIPVGRALIGQLAGAIPAMGPVAAVGRGVQGVAKSAQLANVSLRASRAAKAAASYPLPGWAKAAGLGAIYGGLYGAGGSEGGLAERAQGAAQGAGLGAVTGGTLYPVGRGLQIGAEKLGSSIKSRIAPEATSRAKIGEALRRDEMTPGKIRSRLRELGPQATIADAGGRNVRGLARTAASTPGPAQNRAEIMLDQRAGGEGARIQQALKKGLDPQDYYAAEDAFLKNLRTRAEPFYTEAYEKFQSVKTRGLDRLLKSKVGQSALKEAAEIVENERASGVASYLGKVDEELTAAARSAADVGKMAGVGQPGVLRGLSLRSWDQIKRGFDSLLDRPAYRNELTGKLNVRGRSVDQMRRTLLKELDKATGGEKSVYAKARATYAGDAEAMNALRDGRKSLTIDPELITRRLADLSEAGKEAYRSGVARAIMDSVDRTKDMSSAAGRIFGNTRQRRQIRAAFPDQESYGLLRKMLTAEQQFAKTRNYVHSGSQTQPRQAEASDALAKVGGVAGVFAGTQAAGVTGGHGLLMAGMGRRVGQALLGGNADAHNLAIAKTLFNRNQAMNQRALDTLFDKTTWDALPEAVRQKLGQAVILGATQQEKSLTAVKP